VVGCAAFRFLLVFGILFVSLVLRPRTALAQVGEPAPAPPAGETTPPELVKFVEAPYPEEARQKGLEANVVLELSVDAEGKVTQAIVKEPVGHGFDEAAVAAALKFEFRPARRGERAVASRLLYRYSFHLEQKEVEQAASVAALTGRIVVSGSEHPLAGATVRLLRGDQKRSEQVTGVDGKFSFPDIEPGAYRVVVQASGFEPYEASETLSASEWTEVTYGLVTPSESADEVVVRGTRPSREVTRRTLTRRELSRVPGTSGDALRAIQNLPGVARPPTLSGQLVVRGNGDQATPVLVDGMWISNVYHFGGLSSVIPTEMLDEISFYPGNFSVKYGRALAGVVEAHLRETRDDGRYHGLAQVDLVDARLMLEGPVPLLDGWNFIGGIRRSHVDAWLIPLVEGGEDTQIQGAPVYYDYQFLLDHRPTKKSYLRIGTLGYDDRIRVTNEASARGGQLDAVSAAWGIGSIYHVEFSKQTRAEFTLTVAKQHVHYSESNLAVDLTAYAALARSEIAHRLGTRATLRYGYDVLVGPYEASGRLPQAPPAGAPDVGPALTLPSQTFEDEQWFTLPAVYAEMEMHPSDRSQVVTGVRVDYSDWTQRFDVSPRITGRYEIVPTYPKTTLKGGTGLFHQGPDLFDILLSDENTELRSQRAWQNSLGVEQMLGKNLTASVEGFFYLLDDLVSRAPDESGIVRYNNFGTGRIFGAEGMLRWENDERFFGWLSYTLSRSERTWAPGEPSELFYLDQTHILTVLGSYALGRGWEFGARFRYVTGNLYTPCFGSLYSSTSTSFLCISGAANSERLPPFHQLDVRIDKKWQFSGWTLGAYLDLINAYNRTNPDFLGYNYDYSQSRPETASLPIVPSFGIRGEF
jgi:TonB family protein